MVSGLLHVFHCRLLSHVGIKNENGERKLHCQNSAEKTHPSESFDQEDKAQKMDQKRLLLPF